MIWRHKIFLVLLLVLLALTLIATQFWSSSDGPHGGVVNTVGDYGIELKTASPYLYVFLLNKRGEPIPNKGIMCEVRFVFSGDRELKVSCEKFEKDGFSTLLVTQEYYSVEIFFNVKGKAIISTFENENLIVKKQVIYSLY